MASHDTIEEELYLQGAMRAYQGAMGAYEGAIGAYEGEAVR